MATLLFRLRHVPDDEAEEVRALLREHGIDYYETEPGNWGISMPALWLRDASQLEQATALLSEYQQQRAERVQREYAALRERGEAPTLLTSLRTQPLRFVFYTGLSAAILYLSISSFFSF
jgi:regulator of protease activity HflC (stomatin/prohibitin superfamily)